MKRSVANAIWYDKKGLIIRKKPTRRQNPAAAIDFESRIEAAYIK